MMRQLSSVSSRLPPYFGLRFTCLIFFVICLGGCESTLRQQRIDRITALDAALDKSHAVLEELRSGQLPPKYDLHLFLAHKVVNTALSKLEGYEFPSENDPSITISIKSIRIENYGAFPLVSISGTAKRKSLSVEVDLSAILLPSENHDATIGEFKPSVIAITPKLRWWIFETTKLEFVNAILATKLDSLTKRLPLIRLPIAQAIRLGGDAENRPETIITRPDPEGSTLEIMMSIPSTKRNRQLAVTRYVFLQDGVHAFGDLK
jgi:hypothetical protein